MNLRPLGKSANQRVAESNPSLESNGQPTSFSGSEVQSRSRNARDARATVHRARRAMHPAQVNLAGSVSTGPPTPWPRLRGSSPQFSRWILHTFSYEGKPVLVMTKEHTMNTTIDTNQENSILTIDQAAAYLAIPKATLYTWRTRGPVRTARGEDGRLPALPAFGPRRLGRRAS